MIKRLVIQFVLIILLFIPTSLAFTFGNSNINVTVFDSLAAQSLTSSQLNLSYIVSSMAYFKTASLNLTLPPISLYLPYITPTTIPTGGSSGQSKTSSRTQIATSGLTDLTKELRIGENIDFNIRNDETHNIALISINYKDKEASYVLSSEPVKFTLIEESYRLFDMNNNNLIDLNITLQNVKSSTATTKIQEVAEPILFTTVSTIQPELADVTGEIIREQPAIQPETTNKPNSRKKVLIISVLAILAVSITIALYNKPKKKKHG